MMAQKGMDHASRRKKYCVAMEQGIRRDGKKSASRGRKKGFLERETRSCEAENYELVLLTKEWRGF